MLASSGSSSTGYVIHGAKVIRLCWILEARLNGSLLHEHMKSSELKPGTVFRVIL
jgi:hypothetical protein